MRIMRFYSKPKRSSNFFDTIIDELVHSVQQFIFYVLLHYIYYSTHTSEVAMKGDFMKMKTLSLCSVVFAYFAIHKNEETFFMFIFHVYLVINGK